MKKGNRKQHPQPGALGRTMQQIAATPAQLDMVKQQIIQQQFDGKFGQALKDQIFPPELTNKDWRTRVATAMRFTSPLSLGLTVDQFIKLRDDVFGGVDINMADMAILSNLTEARTQNELQLNDLDYDQFMRDASVISTKWNEMQTPMRLAVIEEIEKGINLKPASVEDKATGHFGAMAAVKDEPTAPVDEELRDAVAADIAPQKKEDAAPQATAANATM